VKTHRHLFFVIIGLIATVAVIWTVAVWVYDPNPPGPFYDTPKSMPGPPGTIIRSEPITEPSVPGADVRRILYVSTDQNDHPNAVSGILIVPRNRRSHPAPIVAWAHGTTGVVPGCAPSLDPQQYIPRTPALQQYVDAGVIVVATDYAGLGTEGTHDTHPYLVGPSEGHAVLDSIRAAQHLVDGEADAPVAIYGHSQGGHATLFAAELAPTYAPELRVMGIAAMAPPTDLGALMRADNAETPGIVLTSLAIVSWSRVYPDTPASAIVKARYLPAVENLARHCITTNGQMATIAPSVWVLRDNYLKRDPTTDSQWAPHFAPNTPKTILRSAPVLVAQGLIDDIVRPQVTERYVQNECDGGARVTFMQYTKAGHFNVRDLSAPAVAKWVLARLAGDPVASDCTTQRVTTAP